MRRKDELAFQRIKCCMIAEGYVDTDTFKDFAIIEGSLHDYERLLKQEVKNIKIIKALKIIKERFLKDLVFHDKLQTVQFSFGYTYFVYKIADKDKYDLLKEVLL